MYHISNGIISSGIVLQSNYMYVSGGGLVSGTVVENEASLYVQQGGSAVQTVVSAGGSMHVSAGGSASDIIASQGAFLWLNVAPDTYWQVTSSGVSVEMKNAVVSNYTVDSRGRLYVSSGGTAAGTIVSNGYLYVYNSGAARSSWITSKGHLYIKSGGVASSTRVASDGALILSSGAVHRGELFIESGAVVSAYQGAVIDFSLEDRTEKSDYLMDGVSLVSGKGSFSITVSASQALGEYKLSQNVKNFSVSMMLGEKDKNYGSITVNGGVFEWNDLYYLLREIKGNLTLKIAEKDILPPEDPVISVSTGNWTNKDVTVSVKFAADGWKNEYSINGGAWQSCSGSVLLTENAAVSFRSSDEFGNMSNVVSYSVNNIDKVKPLLEISSSPDSWTTGNVTVTASASDAESGLRMLQYTLDSGKTWHTYAEKVTIKDNGWIHFRAVDNAGNAVTRGVLVDWIDRKAPQITVTGNSSSWTNGNVTLTAAAEDKGSQLKSFQFSYDGKTWQKYTSALEFSGNGRVYFRAVDMLGNTVTKTVQVQNIDKDAPTLNVSGNVSEWVAEKITLTVTASDAASGIAEILYSLDNKSWREYNGGVDVSSNRTVYFRVVDKAGNKAEQEVVVQKIDRVKPLITIDNDLTKWAQKITLTASAADTGSGLAAFYYSWDNRSWNLYDSGVQVDSNGSVYFKAVDNAGNTTTKRIVINRIDANAPTLTISGNLTSPAAKVTISATAVDSGSGLKTLAYSFDGESWINYTGNITVTENGILYFKAVDLAGNTAFERCVIRNISGGDEPEVPPWDPVPDDPIPDDPIPDDPIPDDPIPDDPIPDDPIPDDPVPDDPIPDDPVVSGGKVEVYAGGKLVSCGTSINHIVLSQGGYDKVVVQSGGRIGTATVSSGTNIILSGGGVASRTNIYAHGGLHVYSGAVAEKTTVHRNGYLGVGNGAVASGTVIGYAGELTVWGGGKVIDNTIDTWGAIILSSGAAAESTTINTNGGLHVYSGAVASSTTIERNGFLGVGLGAAAYDTTVGYAGELTVWSGGAVHRNDINTWGAIILLEGAVANSTTVNEKGGLHIYWGATAYTTRVTSGAVLGIGLGGRLYNSQLENNASMFFYDGSRLSGWNDFAGTVTVNGSVNASGSYISLELMTRSQEQDVIISNIAGFVNVGRFSVEINSSQTGIYKLAGGASADFNREFTLYVDGTDRGKIAIGKSLQYEDINYSIYKEGDTLLLGAVSRTIADDNCESGRIMSGILV